MAGGVGLRLRPLTLSIPKPLIPVGDKPILEHIIIKLKSQGIDEVIFAVGYKSEFIRAYFLNGKKLGIKINYFREEKRLGTAGALSLIKKKFKLTEPVIVMNGDILTELDFNKMIEFHDSKKSDLTVGFKKQDYISSFGVLKFDGEKIKDIQEKPKITFDILAGIYIIKPEIMDNIPKDSFYDMPNLIIDSLNNGMNICAYEIKEHWLGIEDITKLYQANNYVNGN